MQTADTPTEQRQAGPKSFKRLFASCFYLSAFTFGGGYVIIPLMKKKFVDELAWLPEDEMLNMTALAQSAPGAVAVNAALMLGYRVLGIPGALVAILGTVLPPLILLTLISYVYKAVISNKLIQAILEGMQAGVAAVIFDVVYTMLRGFHDRKQHESILLFAAAFILVFVFEFSIPLMIPLFAVLGLLLRIVKEKRRRDPLP